ncbi:cyclophilin-like fold protein [Bacteroidota bacterium]
MKKIIIKSGDIKLHAELNDSETAKAVWDILPLEGVANVWGDEIYFTIPLHVDQEADARQEVEVGTLAFWPAGDAFCIFFGPTPVSITNKPRAYSPVNVFGKILGDATILKQVSDGEQVMVIMEE